MDKEKEIEEFAKKFCAYRSEKRNCKTCCTYLYGYCVENCPYLKISEELINSGYGNVKQAVKGFAEKLKASFYNMEYSAIAIDNKIDNLVTELYGADD